MELDSHTHTSTWPAYGLFSPGFSQEKALYNGKVLGDISNTYLHIHQVMQDNTNDQGPIHFLSSTFVNSGSFWAYFKPTTMIKTVYNLDITKKYMSTSLKISSIEHRLLCQYIETNHPNFTGHLTQMWTIDIAIDVRCNIVLYKINMNGLDHYREQPTMVQNWIK